MTYTVQLDLILLKSFYLHLPKRHNENSEIIEWFGHLRRKRHPVGCDPVGKSPNQVLCCTWTKRAQRPKFQIFLDPALELIFVIYTACYCLVNRSILYKCHIM